MGGVTRTLNISYLRAIPVGKSALIIPLAFCFIRDQKSFVLMLCRHNNPHPQRSSPSRTNDGHDSWRDD